MKFLRVACVRSQAGVTLIGVMTGMGMLLVAILGGMTLTGNVTNMQAKVDIHFRLQQIKENIRIIIQNRSAWEATVDNTGTNASMTCLKNDTTCTGVEDLLITQPLGTGSHNELVLYTPDGAVWYNSNTANEGFSIDGRRCSFILPVPLTYPSAKCPIRAEIRWTPLCDLTGCTRNKIRVHVVFEYTAPSTEKNAIINVSKLSLDVFKEPDSAYQRVIITEEQPSGTDAGYSAAAANSLIDRNFTDVFESGDNILNSGAFPTTQPQFKAGIYECDFTAVANRVGSHRIEVKNVTAGSTIVTGRTAWGPNALVSQTMTTRSSATARLVFNVDTTIRVEHWWAAPTNETINGGRPGTTGEVEIYSIISCIKEV